MPETAARCGNRPPDEWQDFRDAKNDEMKGGISLSKFPQFDGM
jgi:hypothetical protein